MTKKRKLSNFGNPFNDLDDEKKETQQPTTKNEEANIEEQKEEVADSPPPLQPEDNKEEENQFLDQFFEEKQTQEKTHTRKTFVVENELLEEIKRYMKKFGHGFQVRFINEAIRNQLKIVEQESKKLKGKRRPK